MVSISYGHGLLYDFEASFMWKNANTYTTSGDGAGGGTTTVDASFAAVPNDFYNGWFIKYLSATNSDNVGEIKEITGFATGSGTFTHDAFTAQTKNGDTFQLSKFMIIEDGQTLSTPSSEAGDYLKVQAMGSAGNKIGYVQNTTDITSYSTTLYPKIRFRYKCSNANVKAKIFIVYNDATTQTVLDQTNSTTLTVGTVTLTGANLSKIRFPETSRSQTEHMEYLPPTLTETLTCSWGFLAD